MRILMVGSGAREHSLIWHLRKSPMAKEFFCAPGNAGIAELAKCVNIKATDIDGLMAFAKEKAIDLTIVGSEDPLALGIVDKFRAAGLTIFGPTAAMAKLESSKVYAKRLMKKLGIPSARFLIVEKTGSETEDLQTANAAIEDFPEGMVVVKGDGLAAGKGVEVSKTRQAALAFVKELLYGKKYGSHQAVVLEERLIGEEASVMLIASGQEYLLFDSSQDHKAIFDGDLGPNTGGMGAYSPAPVVTPEIMKQIQASIIKPLLAGMMEEVPGGYQGTHYFGLMITDKGPEVLEINCRPGDPETEVVIPRLKTDLVPTLYDVACGHGISIPALYWDPRPCVGVVLASRGYPESKEIGQPIKYLYTASHEPGVMVFHAGTKRVGDEIQTDGGRVCCVTAMDDTMKMAKNRADFVANYIDFPGKQLRTDIANRAINRLTPAQ